MRLALLCDFGEERWLAMDRLAEALPDALRRSGGSDLEIETVRPPFHRRLTRILGVESAPFAFTVDRVLNRYRGYPRHVRRRVAGSADVYHVLDHSYAHVALELPGPRTVVTLHDLDAFRCILDASHRRSAPHRWIARRTLSGLRRAARVVCVSEAVRREALAHRLVPAERMTVAPLGVDDPFRPMPDLLADGEASRLLERQPGESEELLHVGSTVPRKRIDVLLRVFAAVRRRRSSVRLVRVGGSFTSEQRTLARELGVEGAVDVLPFLDRDTLAAVYRRAAVALQPSEREGFGLPVVEALACGTPVVATDLPVLREVGGAAAQYRPLGAVGAWRDAVLDLLMERTNEPAHWNGRRERAARHGGRYRWEEHARTLVALYGEVVERAEGGTGTVPA